MYLNILAIMTFTLQVLGATVLHSSLGHPSQTVTLVYPGSKVNLNQNVSFGVGDPPSGYGLDTNVTFTVGFPNGTNEIFGWETSACFISQPGSNDTAAFVFHADAVGKWQLMWNFNYTYYADAAKLNASSCPWPGSASSEFFNLTAEFEVAKLGNAVMVPDVTTTSQLPSAPTGYYQSPNSANRQSIEGMSILFFVLSFMVMG